MSVIIWALVLALTPLDTVPPDPVDECLTQSRTIVVQTTGNDGGAACGQAQAVPCQAVCTAVCQAAGDGPQKKVCIVANGSADGDCKPFVWQTTGGEQMELPKIWIGVRLTAVPKPLAAHIGADGVMISNVVKDSPADKAGLEQYDVVIGFENKDVKTPQDLTAALADWKAGRTAKLTLLRGGKKKTATIKPMDRPADVKWELKYDEPDDVFVDNHINMRGLTLNQGPGGAWTIEELGPLQGMPDVLKKLEKFELKLDGSQNGGMQFLYGGPDDALILNRCMPGFIWNDANGGDAKVRINVIKTNDDGSVISIQTGEDGKIEVERTDADGNKTSVTYDSVEQLQEQDPDAAQFFNSTARADTAFIKVEPFGPDAVRLRDEFQVNVEEKLREAMERVEAARARAQEALEHAQSADQDLTTDDSILGARVDDSGKTTIYVRGEDGQVRKYQFESVDALEAAEPELYAKVKSLLE